MAEKKVYIGSVGPFLYDDADLIDDVDGDFAGENYTALTTDGQMLIEGAPINLNHIVRLQDLINMLIPTFVDVTAGRALNTVYQNGDYLTFAQISLRLREESLPPIWVASTVYAVGDIVRPTTYNYFYYKCVVSGTSGIAEPVWGIIEGGTTIDNTVTWVCYFGPRANFLEESVNPPTVVVGIGAKALGGSEYIELTLSMTIPPNHYYMLEEDQPTVEILRWLEYQIGV